MAQDDLGEVKRRLRAAKQDATAARVLAGAADRRFEQVDRGFAEMRGKLDATAGGQQHIADLIQRLINGQDR